MSGVGVFRCSDKCTDRKFIIHCPILRQICFKIKSTSRYTFTRYPNALQTLHDHPDDHEGILYAPIPSRQVGYRLDSSSLTTITLTLAVARRGRILRVLPRSLACALGFGFDGRSARETNFCSCHN